MDIKSNIARAKLTEGFNCAQSIVSAFAKDVGLDAATALKVAGAFGGGLAHHGQVCGAVSGALMIISMKYVVPRSGYVNRDQAFTIATIFMEEFKERHQTIDCRQLISCDLATPEGLKRFRDEQIFENVCPRWVQDAAEILDEVMQIPATSP